MFELDMDTKPLIQHENDLDRFGKKALPYAHRDTLNTAAWKSSVLAKKKVGQLFTERNQWTRRSIRFDKAKSLDTDRMESHMGSIQEYMRRQEEGFTQTKKGKHGVAIPTGAAAGQMGARKRTRRLQKKNWLSTVNPVKAARHGGSTVAAVRDAVASGKRTVFLTSSSDHYGRTTGLYRVIGGRKGGNGWPKGAKLQLLYQTNRPSVRTDAHKWMGPPVHFVMKGIDKIYRDAVTRQIRINRSFRNRG